MSFGSPRIENLSFIVHAQLEPLSPRGFVNNVVWFVAVATVVFLFVVKLVQC